MASYVQGYDAHRFVTRINRSFFCSICVKVFRDPVVCPKNEHYFCRSCITKYLETAQRCPTCEDHLTVETLVNADRVVKDSLNGSQIRCVYIEQGCDEILPLADIDKHEATCGFTPVACTNEGCDMIVSRRDLVHHESEVCEFRKLKCHSCEETAKTLTEIAKRMTKMEANMKEKMENIEKNMKEDVEKNKAELKQELQAGMATLRRNIEQQNMEHGAELQADTAILKRDLDGRLEAVNSEVAGLKAALVECFGEMKDVLVKFDSDRKKVFIGEVRSRPSGDRENILVAGGFENSSVEMFDCRKKQWLPLQPLPEERHAATSFICNDHMIIAGGYGPDYSMVDTMIHMNVKAGPDPLTCWSEHSVKLPSKLAFHSSVVYNGKLIVTGGSNELDATFDRIYEMQLSHPYTWRILSKMPQRRQDHGSAMFDDNLLIIGGRSSCEEEDSLNSVLLYDVKKNEYKNLAPLPYEVCGCATVKYGDNIVVVGGSDKCENPLNTVVMYNVMTQQCYLLPPMKCKRDSSAAIVIGNNIVVLGGCDSELNPLKSAEVFNFDTNTWCDLPEMSKARDYHTAVAV